MTRLVSLHIDTFRCISQIKAEDFSPGINLLSGPNGSGKTSFLETIYLLAHGRSFRTRDLNHTIMHNAPSCCVVAKIANKTPQGKAFEITVGVEKHRHTELKTKVDQDVVSKGRVAQQVPLRLINPQDSVALFYGGPLARRMFLDWGVFHVKHDYLQDWQQFSQLLRQRNSLLRQGGSVKSLESWDVAFAGCAEKIDAARKSYLRAFKAELFSSLEPHGEYGGVEIEYRSGWSEQHDLLRVLQRSRARELALGYTCHGPHRADVIVSVAGHTAAADYFSRGQLKKLLILFYMAQGRLLFQQTANTPIYLLDDISAELDQQAQQVVMDAFLQDSAQPQVFVTTLDESTLASFLQSKTGIVKRYKMSPDFVEKML